MTAPVTGPTGQPTLDAIITFLENAVSQLSGPAVALVQAGMGALKAFEAVVDPAAGREIEREAELAAMFSAKNVAGLQAYYADVPAHPNKSLAICASYLKALNAPLKAV